MSRFKQAMDAVNEKLQEARSASERRPSPEQFRNLDEAIANALHELPLVKPILEGGLPSDICWTAEPTESEYKQATTLPGTPYDVLVEPLRSLLSKHDGVLSDILLDEEKRAALKLIFPGVENEELAEVLESVQQRREVESVRQKIENAEKGAAEPSVSGERTPGKLQDAMEELSERWSMGEGLGQSGEKPTEPTPKRVLTFDSILDEGALLAGGADEGGRNLLLFLYSNPLVYWDTDDESLGFVKEVNTVDRNHLKREDGAFRQSAATVTRTGAFTSTLYRGENKTLGTEKRGQERGRGWERRQEPGRNRGREQGHEWRGGKEGKKAREFTV